MSRKGFEPETEGNTSDHIANRCLPSYQPMVLVFCALAAGILVDRTLDFDAWIYACIVFLAGLAWFAMFAKQCAAAGVRRSYISVGVMSCLLSTAVASTGSVLHHARWNWVGPNNIALYASDVALPVCLEAIVTSEPRWQAVEDDGDQMNAIPLVDRTQVVVKPKRIRNGTIGKTHPAKSIW